MNRKVLLYMIIFVLLSSSILADYNQVNYYNAWDSTQGDNNLYYIDIEYLDVPSNGGLMQFSSAKWWGGPTAGSPPLMYVNAGPNYLALSYGTQNNSAIKFVVNSTQANSHFTLNGTFTASGGALTTTNYLHIWKNDVVIANYTSGSGAISLDIGVLSENDEITIEGETVSPTYLYIEDDVILSWVDGSPVVSNLTITAQTYGATQLNNFNTSVLYAGVLYNYTTTTGAIVTGINNSAYVNITISSFFDNTYINQTMINFFNNQSSITFNYSITEIRGFNAFDGSIINSFTTTTNNNLINYTTNNLSIFYMNNGTYNFSFNSPGFNEYNLTNILLNNSFNYLNISTYAHNSILINIYNLTSLLPILQNVTIDIVGDNWSSQNITNTSTILLTYFNSSNYTFTFSSAGYEDAVYNVFIGNHTYQNLNAYLQDITNTDVIFTLRDYDTSVTIGDVTFTIEQFINGSFILINSLLTDLAGNVEIPFIDGARYRFSASKSGYDTRIFELNPIIFNSYTVRLKKSITQDDSTDYSNINIILTPTTYINDVINNFSFYISSPTGNLVIYSYNLSYKTQTETGSGNNVYGEVLTDSLNITGASFFDKVYLEYTYTPSDGNTKRYTRVYNIQNFISGSVLFSDIKANNYNLPLFDRLIVYLLTTIAGAGISFMFGGPMIGIAMGVLFIGYFGYIGFIPIWAVLISITPILFLMFGRSTL